MDGTRCNLTSNACGTVRVRFAPQTKNIVRIAWGSENYWAIAVRGKFEDLVKYTVH